MLRWVRAFLVLVVVLPGAVTLRARPAAAYNRETVYAIGADGTSVAVLDPGKPNSAEKIIPVAPGAMAIVLPPDGLRACVAHRGSAPSITVIDTVVDKAGSSARLDTGTGVAAALLSGLSTRPQGLAVGDVPQLPYLDLQAALAATRAVGPAYTWTAGLRNADARLSAEARATFTFAGTAVEVTGVQAPTGVRCSAVRGGVGCDLSRVPPGGSVPIDVRVRPADGGTVRGTLTVTSDHPDPRPADNTATATAGGRG